MVGLWKATRIVRWALMPLYAAFYIEFLMHTARYLDWAGRLDLPTEAAMYGIPILFVVLGMTEAALRQNYNIPRPKPFGFAPYQGEQAPPAAR